MVGGKGAGKSTLLRLLSTLLKPSAGTAKVNGLDIIEDELKVRDSIGVASEEAGIYSRMTIRENIRFLGRLHTVSESELSERISELLQAFNLIKDADDPASKLTQTQRNRLKLACAAIHRPPLLLVDLPSSEEDMITTRLIESFLTSYAADDRTVIKTTRSLIEARILCRKMAILRDGFLVANGSISDIEGASTESGLREALTELNLRESS